MNVAQLKPMWADKTVNAPLGFHVRMNVAQLKRPQSADVGLVQVVFPRSNERGSIEAQKSKGQPKTF